jgi:hypothetical protein
MVLGLVRSRYHVPLQLTTTLITISAVYVKLIIANFEDGVRLHYGDAKCG